MKTYREIKTEEYAFHPFTAFAKDWMLVTAEKDGKVNTLTAGWGGFGTIWGKPAAFIFIRPQRYTREFIDAADTLSLTFFDEDYRQQLSYCGQVSGRDEDKIAHCGFHTVFDGKTPYFEEAHTVLLGKKLYRQLMESDCFVDTAIDAAMYPKKDYHYMYVVGVEKVLVEEE
jgi:flavin reductase (DIM6/NTAB) family NADH-FMN oxidoreductase RutF